MQKFTTKIALRHNGVNNLVFWSAYLVFFYRDGALGVLVGILGVLVGVFGGLVGVLGVLVAVIGVLVCVFGVWLA